MEEGGFSFPSLPKPKPLAKQNPLLQGATVVDKSKNAMPPSQPPSTNTEINTASGSRRKVPFEKGYSQMDWIRLTQSKKDLSGLNGSRPRRDIPFEEVKQHNTIEDGWTILHGKVYNISPYLRFHPGGPEILRKILGKDGTSLFNKYHAWVNAEFLLEKCCVGTLHQPS